MINVSPTIFKIPGINANLNALIVENSSLEDSAEYELPNQYINCAVRYGSFEYNGNTINTFLEYSPEMTKINISANSKVVVLSRQT